MRPIRTSIDEAKRGRSGMAYIVFNVPAGVGVVVMNLISGHHVSYMFALLPRASKLGWPMVRDYRASQTLY
jgi:hypothetical protein